MKNVNIQINVERFIIGVFINISLILIICSTIADVILYYFKYMIQRFILGHNDNQLDKIGTTISHLANCKYVAEDIVKIMEPMRKSALTEDGMLQMISREDDRIDK